MRRFFACLALIILLAPGTFLRSVPIQKNNSQTISLTPVALNALKPRQKHIGALEFLNGWELRSKNTNFGGISSMLVRPDSRILALSDGGYLFSFGLIQSSSEKLADTRDFIAPLPQASSLSEGKEARDTESFVHDKVGGRYWVGFEDSNGIARYDAALTRQEAFHIPDEMRDWPLNSGPEAMVLLGAGGFLVFSEDEETGEGLTDALLFKGDPVNKTSNVTRFSYRPPSGYLLTDATTLPDGRLITVNRRFNVLEGVSARITIADPADIAAGSVLEGRVIAAIDPPLTVDNMEAIAVTQDGEDIIIWLASDNNFNSLQRTLLMKFRLDLEKADDQMPLNPGLSSLRP